MTKQQYQELFNILTPRMQKQLIEYATLNNKLYKANESEIYEITGCLSNCNKYHYDAQPMTDIEVIKTDYGNKQPPNNTLELSFVFTNGHHEVKEEVIIFNPCTYNNVQI